MQMNEMNRDEMSRAIDSVSGQLGGDGEKMKEAINSGSLDKVLKNLKPGDAEKIQKLLSNKAETERLLQTPQAQMLLKRFLGGK